MKSPRISVLVHGGPGSIEAVRARGLARRLTPDAVRFHFREDSRANTLRAWAKDLHRDPPELIYVLNTALPGVPLAIWRHVRSGTPYILDTGDVICEMARRSGIGGGWRLPLLWMIEQSAWRQANRIVVRGTRHRDFLRSRGLPATLIRDGYADQQDIRAEKLQELRSRWQLEGRFVVGLMGSLVWSPRLQICYGWDLVRALTHLRDLPISAVVIGDGNGRPWLEDEAKRLGVHERLIFTGRIPYAEVPAYMRLLDVALSTQTNNLPGQVRTTGKLPEYMAAGCHILASRVGEAELLLPEAMLVPFEGEVDHSYPLRLAGRIRELVDEPERRKIRHNLPSVAAAACSYEVLSRDWLELINEVLAETGRPPLS